VTDLLHNYGPPPQARAVREGRDLCRLEVYDLGYAAARLKIDDLDPATVVRALKIRLEKGQSPETRLRALFDLAAEGERLPGFAAVVDSPGHSDCCSQSGVCRDPLLTLTVASKASSKVFLAGKTPVLSALRIDRKFALVLPARRRPW
jgi:hypothetical protein